MLIADTSGHGSGGRQKVTNLKQLGNKFSHAIAQASKKTKTNINLFHFSKTFFLFNLLCIFLYTFITIIFFFLINYNQRKWLPPNYLQSGIVDNMVDAVVMYGGDWMGYNQNYDGSFQYIYYPSENKNGWGQNILRHAGTVYSILLLYEHTNNKKYLNIGKKGLNYLVRQKKKLKKDIVCIKYNFRIKLGGAALTLLGLTKYQELTKDMKYDKLIRDLSNFIIMMQKDTGEFIAYYEKPKKTSAIYPGEAMLALVKVYKLIGDEKYLNALLKSYEFYSSASFNWRMHAFIPWTTSASWELYSLTKEEKYAQFAFKLTDFIVKTQTTSDRKDSKGNSVKGGFAPQEQVNTGSYMEGIGDAYKTALMIDDKERIKRYRNTLTLGAEWIMSLQFRDDWVSGFSRPRKAFGGFHKYLTGEGWDEIRVDYTQHCVSALIRILDTFDKKEIGNIAIRPKI